MVHLQLVRRMLLDGELVTKALWIPNLQENLKFSRNSIGKAFIKQSNSIFPSKVSCFSYFFLLLSFSILNLRMFYI